jgi:peptide deformylase
MILSIVGYGNPVLKKQAQEITKDYPELPKLIEDMFETMYAANGVGLAAPQVNLSIRLVVIDAEPFKEVYPEAEGFKKVFINPTILEYKGEIWSDFEEGCLSLPEIHEEVARPSEIVVKYYDENFQEHTEEFVGIRARVFQHEYDHLEGKVFVDRLSAIRKTLLKRRLSDIANNKVRTSYRMKMNVTKKR